MNTLLGWVNSNAAALSFVDFIRNTSITTENKVLVVSHICTRVCDLLNIVDWKLPPTSRQM